MTLGQSVRPLPARVVPIPGESLVSLVRRTAAAMGYESPARIRGLLADAGKVPTNINLISPGDVLNRLAELLRFHPSDLQSTTFHRFARQLVLAPRDNSPPASCDTKTLLRYFTTAMSPVCPRCLNEDTIPFERLTWSLRFVPFCTTHQCLLVARCPGCDRPLRHARNDAATCSCGHDIATADVNSVSSRANELVVTLARTLIDEAVVVPDMSAAATLWWAERLATSASKTPAWLDHVAKRLHCCRQQNVGALPWFAAAEILCDWPQRLEEFLEAFQQIAKHRTTSTGISRRFGLLLREATQLEQLGYAAPANALRDYLLRHYAAGHLNGKICLFQEHSKRSQLESRPWITQTEAAKRLHLRSGAIGPLVARGILIGQMHSAGQRGRSLGLISRRSVELLRSEIENALTVCAAAKRLGVGRHAILDFIHDDLLPLAVRTARGWKIPKPAIEDLESFCAGLQSIDATSPDWISLRQATRIGGPSGLSMSQIVKRIRAGSLAACMADRQLGLNGIVISRADLATSQGELQGQQEPTCDWSLHRAGRNLFPGQPMKPRILKKWIDLGLLRPKRKGKRFVVTTAEIGRFRADYCWAKEAARFLGISRSTLSRWEQAGRIQPVYGKRVTPGAGFSLYRRADLRQFMEVHS